MDLSDIWFGLFIVIVCGYLILDGFDIGVGALHLFVAKNDEERRLMLNSIGPVWDGNGVWLVLTGGVLFAVFPPVYASLFSGLYLAFFLVLVAIILRTASIEFRSKRPSARWRKTWDIVFAFASIGLALLLGIAFGNLLDGLPVNAQGDIEVSLIDLLTPFALLVGVTTVVMFVLHGSIFVSLKTEGALQQRVRRAMPKLIIAFLVLLALTAVGIVIEGDEVQERYVNDIWPFILPLAALVALGITWNMLRRGHDFKAFIASATMIALLIISAAVGLFPNMLISSTDEQYSLTLDNATAASNTMTVALIFALIGMPLVLLYTAGVYYFFRGKTRLEQDSY